MLSLLFLIPIALVITGVMIWFLLWAIRNGQYEDLDRAGREALYDEPIQSKAPEQKSLTEPEKAEPSVDDR